MISDFGDRTVTQITTSSQKLVVLLDDGSIREWNLYQGVREYRVTLDLSNTKYRDAKIIQIGTQNHVSMGLLDNGTIKIWELVLRENGEYVRQYFDYQPGMNMHIHVPEKVRQIACGLNFSIALLIDGSIAGWGNGAFGQISAVSAFRSSEKTDVKQIACGMSYSLVLFNNGYVEMLTKDVDMSIPVDMEQRIQGHVVQIACADRHALVLLDGGAVAGWFTNGFDSHETRVIPDKIRGF